MKKAVVGVLLLVFFSVLCPAQTSKDNTKSLSRPNLGGTWVLDVNGSDFGGPRSRLAYDSLTLIISQQDPEFRITLKIVEKKKERSQQLIYFTDGRGERNPAFNERVTVQSKTNWEGDTLVTKGTAASRQTVLGTITSETTDRWDLSADGKTLIQTSHSGPPRSKANVDFGSIGAQNARKVYRKQA